MTALTRLLFPLPAFRRSPGVLFGWWESRRPAYNAIVGTAGLVTLGAVHLIALLPPYLPMHVPWQAIALYAICANACYSFGFLFEAMLERLWGNDVPPAGPALFRQGLAFSIGLTLFPIALAWLGYLFAVISMILRV